MLKTFWRSFSTVTGIGVLLFSLAGVFIATVLYFEHLGTEIALIVSMGLFGGLMGCVGVGVYAVWRAGK